MQEEPDVLAKEVIAMKYHVTAKQVRMMPEEKAAALWEGAREWTSKRLSDGTLDCHYVFPDGSGGMAIIDAESHEALWGTIVEHPFYRFMDWLVAALCDWSVVYDRMLELLHG